jgi:predicted alpha/beta-hydrolase family hydrolase
MATPAPVAVVLIHKAGILVYSPHLAVVSTAAAAQGVSAGDAVVQDARTHSPAAAGYANA